MQLAPAGRSSRQTLGFAILGHGVLLILLILHLLLLTEQMFPFRRQLLEGFAETGR